MNTDEQEIRDLVATWMAATKAGDAAKVLSLMTDDVVFLVPGRPVMGKPEFAAAQAGQAAMDIEGTSDIQEIKVLGDWAFMWSKLQVIATPPGAQPVKRAGYTLSILRKENGVWRIARDANMLAPA
jgi:uncharacterized protein (TIGR02246 family)